jgi:hypothetical protein
MRRLFLAGALGLASAAAHAAGVVPSLPHVWGGAAVYAGPGDVVAGAGHCWSLRACTAANIGQTIVTIQRASDSATLGLTALPDGGVDVPSARSFCAGTPCTAIALYDQVVTTDCTGPAACDMAVGTAAPDFRFDCIEDKPCLDLVGPTDRGMCSPGNALSQAQPVTLSTVFRPDYGGGINDAHLVFAQGNSGFQPTIDYLNTTSIRVRVGAIFNVPYVRLAWSSFQAVFDGASSVGRNNGAETVGDPGTGGIANTGTWSIGARNCATNVGTGTVKWTESIYWPFGLDAAQRAAIQANQEGFWAFPAPPGAGLPWPFWN